MIIDDFFMAELFEKLRPVMSDLRRDDQLILP
jgi:hypothetical protein